MDKRKRGILGFIDRVELKQTPARKEMTRGQQTAWIVGVIIIVALFALNYAKTHDRSDPYARCHGLIPQGSACEAMVASERLDRLSQ